MRLGASASFISERQNAVVWNQRSDKNFGQKRFGSVDRKSRLRPSRVFTMTAAALIQVFVLGTQATA
jgi:hypothetical protein